MKQFKIKYYINGHRARGNRFLKLLTKKAKEACGFDNTLSGYIHSIITIYRIRDHINNGGIVSINKTTFNIKVVKR